MCHITLSFIKYIVHMYRPVSSHRGQPLYNIKIASELAGPKMSVIDLEVPPYVAMYHVLKEKSVHAYAYALL